MRRLIRNCSKDKLIHTKIRNMGLLAASHRLLPHAVISYCLPARDPSVLHAPDDLSQQAAAKREVCRNVGQEDYS